MFDRILANIAHWVYRHPLWILAVALLLTLGCGYYATGLSIKADIGDLLPENTFSVKHSREVSDRIGASGNLMVMVEGHDADKMKLFASDLAAALMERKEQRQEAGEELFVKNVQYRNEIEFFEDHALYWLSLDELAELWEQIDDEIRKRKLKANPLYVDLLEGEDDGEGDSDWSFDRLQKKYNTGDFKEYLISDDETVLAVLVRPMRPSSDLSFSKRLLDHVWEVGNELIATGKYDTVTFDLGGSYRNKLVERNSIIADIIRSFSGTFVLLTILMVIYFRRVRAVVVILLPLMCAIIWALAVAEFQYGYLNMITAFIFAILLGLGIDFGIHFLNRYQEARFAGADPYEALTIAETKTGRAIVTGSLTTSVAFFALMIADFRGFSQFGFIAGVGVLFCLLATLFINPAILMISEKILPLRKPDLAPKQKAPIPVPQPGLIVLAATVLTLVGVYAVLQSFVGHGYDEWHTDTQRCAPSDTDCVEPLIDFEYNFAKLRTRDNPILNMSKIYGKAMPLSLQPAIVICEDYADCIKFHEYVMDMRDANPDTTIKIVRSLRTFLPDQMDRKQRSIRAIGRLLTDDNIDLIDDPERREDAERLRKMTRNDPVKLFELPDKILRAFSIVGDDQEDVIDILKELMGDWPGQGLGEDFKAALAERWAGADDALRKRVAGLLRDWAEPDKRKNPDPDLARLIDWTQSSLGILAMVYTNVDTWNGIASKRFSDETAAIQIDGKDYHPAGETYVFADTLWAMEQDVIRSLLASMFVVFLVVWLDFRSFRQTLWVVLPLVVGLVFLSGVMAISGIRLNFFNMVVFPSLIGIGVDNGIHIYHRYREEGRGSIPKVIATSGWAVTLASITTMFGFAGMLMADHAGLMSLGELAIIGLTSLMIASVLVFPALLILSERKHMDARKSWRKK